MSQLIKLMIFISISLIGFSLFAQGEMTTTTPQANPSSTTTPLIPIPNTMPTIDTSAGDSAINTNVQDKITSDSMLNGANIIVSTVNGVVTLSGTVTSADQSKEAIRITKIIPGVRNVKSILVVQPPVLTPDITGGSPY